MGFLYSEEGKKGEKFLLASSILSVCRHVMFYRVGIYLRPTESDKTEGWKRFLVVFLCLRDYESAFWNDCQISNASVTCGEDIVIA